MNHHLFIQVLQDVERYYSNLLAKLNHEYSALPKGGLVQEHRKDKTFFYVVKDGVRKGITKDKQYIDQLLRARYLKSEISRIQKLLVDLRKNRQRLEMIHGKQDTNADLLRRFENSGLDLHHGIWTPKQIKMNGKQSENPYDRDKLVVRTRDGIYTRSFSEQTWGNLYHELGIPYQYEKQVVIDVTELEDVSGAIDEDGRLYKYYYPDFYLPMADDTFFLHEHLGLIDKKDYRSAVGERIVAYVCSGFVPLDRLLLTFPGDVRDPRRFRDLLIHKVCPYV